MPFAIVETGGKQYRIAKGEKLKVEKLNAKEGDSIFFERVLLVSDGDGVKIGSPYLENAKVEGKVLRQDREKKKIVFRYHPKTRYHKKKGHRQPYTEVEIIKID